MRLARQTVSNIIANFVRKGHVAAGEGGNRTSLARTDDVNYYVEYCKKVQPSIDSSEIQRKLVENNVCLQQNVPSRSSITLK